MSTEERVSTYRDDITEALVQSVIRRSGHASLNEAGLWQAAYQDADAVLAVRDTELERLHTWDGLIALLDEHWPEDIIPTVPDSEDRDPGPRIVSLLRWVERLKKENEDLSSFIRPLLMFHEMSAAAAPPEDRKRMDAKRERIKAILDTPTPGDTP